MDWLAAEKRRVFPSKDGAQEAHEAVRVTHNEIKAAADDDAQRRLYQLIRLHTLASVLEDAIFTVRKATPSGTTTAGEKAKLIGQGCQLVSPAWNKVYEAAVDETEVKEGDGDDRRRDQAWRSAAPTSCRASAH